MKFIPLISTVLLLFFHLKEASTNIPSYMLQKIENSLSFLEGKATKLQESLDHNTKKNQLEFLEIKRLLQQLTGKIGSKSNDTLNKNKSFSQEESIGEGMVDKYWDALIGFCGYQSQHELLEKVATRNTKQFQYSSINEELNECVYLDGLCGGILVGKKGIISYRAKDEPTFSLNNRAKCIWTIRSNDPHTVFKLYLRKGNQNGFKLSVTSMQDLLSAGTNKTAIEAASKKYEDEAVISRFPAWPNGKITYRSDSKKGDDVCFVTLTYNKTASIPDFFLMFEGNGTQNYTHKFYHYHKAGGKGEYHSKIDFSREYQRTRHEYATFVINPHDEKKSFQPFAINLTHVHTRNEPRYEYFTFFQNQRERLDFKMAGGERSIENRYYGFNKTFYNEFLGDLSSEAYIGIMKFYNPNEYTQKQETELKFSW